MDPATLLTPPFPHVGEDKAVADGAATILIKAKAGLSSKAAGISNLFDIGIFVVIMIRSDD